MQFLDVMAEMTARPLSEFSKTWQPLQQTLEPQPAAAVSKTCSKDCSAGREELLVPGGTFSFYVKGNCIEGDSLPAAVDVQFPWEEHPQRSHQTILEMPALYADRYPVTNADYATFLAESGWSPIDPHNWLRHWQVLALTPATLARLALAGRVYPAPRLGAPARHLAQLGGRGRLLRVLPRPPAGELGVAVARSGQVPCRRWIENTTSVLKVLRSWRIMS